MSEREYVEAVLRDDLPADARAGSLARALLAVLDLHPRVADRFSAEDRCGRCKTFYPCKTVATIGRALR